MLSIQSSVTEKNIQEAKENFVNHVFSRGYIKLCKTANISDAEIISGLNKKNIDLKYYELYKSSHGYKTKITSEIIKLINDDFYNIISNPPEELSILQNKYLSESDLNNHAKIVKRKNRVEKFKKTNKFSKIWDRVLCLEKLINSRLERISLFEKIFDYESLSNGYIVKEEKQYNLYDLGKDLNLRTCPYCNKNYIFTIEDNENKSGKLVNATFDHWFPQSKYPLLQLSFYNLIPSCSNCNSSIKNDDDFSKETHIHPYIIENESKSKENITSKYKFNYLKDEKGNPLVYIDYLGDKALNKKLRRTFSDFKTEKIYAAQLTELKDMIELATEYGEDYIETLEKSFPEANLSKERVYNTLFNTSEEDDKHRLRPLSKFRYDILRKLLIIK